MMPALLIRRSSRSRRWTIWSAKARTEASSDRSTGAVCTCPSMSTRLVELGIEWVVMEATSDYWKPVFYVRYLVWPAVLSRVAISSSSAPKSWASSQTSGTLSRSVVMPTSMWSM